MSKPLMEVLRCSATNMVTRLKHCQIKMLPVTYEYSRCYICQVNPIQCYHRTNMTPLIIFLRTIQQNVAYGYHTELAWFNLSIFTRGVDCLTSGQSYKSLMRFIDPNWDTNIIHKSPMRVNEIHSPILFRFAGLGHTYDYSISLPIPLNPKPSSQCFNRRPLTRFMRVNVH